MAVKGLLLSGVVWGHSHLPGLWQPADGNVAQAHHDGEEGVEILEVLAAGTVKKNTVSRHADTGTHHNYLPPIQ